MGRLSKQVVVFHNESAVNTTHLPPYDLYEHTLKNPKRKTGVMSDIRCDSVIYLMRLNEKKHMHTQSAVW